MYRVLNTCFSTNLELIITCVTSLYNSTRRRCIKMEGPAPGILAAQSGDANSRRVPRWRRFPLGDTAVSQWLASAHVVCLVWAIPLVKHTPPAILHLLLREPLALPFLPLVWLVYV